MNLIEISNNFPTEQEAVKYFGRFRQGKKPACPYCVSFSIGERNKDLRFHCKDCFKSFSVTTNTNLHNTRLPLKSCLYAFAVESDVKKGISAKQLERNLGIHSESAWTMYHKRRDLMTTLLRWIQRLLICQFANVRYKQKAHLKVFQNQIKRLKSIKVNLLSKRETIKNLVKPENKKQVDMLVI